jgi:DNA-binding HxlR family transcriptional regulator
MSTRKNFDHLNHGLADALGVVGEWWTPLIVWSIHEGEKRFEGIQSDLGTARNILTDRLNTLVVHGVVEKRQYSERPRRFEYHLTERGNELIPVFSHLETWGNKWMRGSTTSATASSVTPSLTDHISQ